MGGMVCCCSLWALAAPLDQQNALDVRSDNVQLCKLWLAQVLLRGMERMWGSILCEDIQVSFLHKPAKVYLGGGVSK